jgi:hypothetical protein
VTRRQERRNIVIFSLKFPDEEAFMQLVLSNAQSELSPLEIGVHALEYVTVSAGGAGNKGGLREYARQIGKQHQHIVRYRQAAIVLRATKESGTITFHFLSKAEHLAAIHSAPQDIWHLLVEAMLEGEWSKDDTEKIVKRVNDLLTAIPDWWTVDRLSVLERDEPDVATCIALDALLKAVKPFSQLKSLLQICYRLSASATGFATS